MKDTPLERGLMRLAQLTWRRPGLVLTVVAVITVAMGALAMDVRMDTSFMGILDDDDPAMLRFAETSRRFPSSSSVVLVLTEGEESRRQEAAEAAAAALEQLDIVSAATARVDTEIAAEIGLVYINDDDFRRLEGSLEALKPLTQAAPTLPSALQAVADRLSEPPSGPVDPEEALGALDAIIGLIDQIAALPATEEAVTEGLVGAVFPAPERGPGGAVLRDGYLASADGRVYAVDLRTDLDPLSVEIGAGSFSVMEAQIDPIRAAFPDVVLRFAGLLPGAYQDQQNVLNKIIPLSTLTLVLVLLALTALDRSPVTSLAVGLCLLVSMVWTFGLVRLVFGYASLMVTACGIMLFGLGVDYAVHIVVRYNDERASGVEGEEAMRRALGRTGRGVVIGGLTTITAFALMTLTDFKAAYHLGVAAAIGLGCALILMLTALPALLRLLDRWGRRERVSVNLPVLDALVVACVAYPRRVGLAVALVGVGVLTQLPRFQLETDLEKIITQDLPALQAAEDLASAFGGSAEAILSESASVAESRERAVAFEALPEVARVDGIHRLIPEDAPARLERNRALLPLLAELGRPTPEARGEVPAEEVVAQLERLRKHGVKITMEARRAGRIALAAKGAELKDAATAAAAAVAGQDAALAKTEAALFGSLSTALDRLETGASLTEFGPDQLPEAVRGRYMADGRFLSLVYPADYRIAFEALRDFKAAVIQIDPSATGSLFVVDQLLVGGLDKLPVALVAILFALTALLGLDLRSARKVAIALVPLVMGAGVGVSLVIASGVPISVLMLAAMPLIFGIGIDDGVHILHRWDEGGPDVAKAVAATGKAILFTSLTTGLGFSILFLLDHNGLKGMAVLVLMGVGTCFLSSVTILPVLASLSRRE